MFYQLEWTDRKGGFRCERGTGIRLAEKLQTIRCDADLWLLDEHGVKIQTIGGCERANGVQDDKRIKWAWWYDKTAL